MTNKDVKDALPAPIIYKAFEGTLGYQTLVPEGALVDIRVGQWFNPDPTDTVVLYLDDKPIDRFPTDGAGLVVKSVEGRVFSGELIGGTDRFEGDGPHRVRYEVVYDGEGKEESQITDVVVKCSKPGGSHPQPVDQVNDRLAVIVAEPLAVDETTDPWLLTIDPWINMAVDDKATVYIGGQPFALPPVTDPTTPQTLSLSKSDLETIKNGYAVPVTYKIVDIAGNSSGFAPYIATDIWTAPPGSLEATELYYADSTPVTPPGTVGSSSSILGRVLALREADLAEGLALPAASVGPSPGVSPLAAAEVDLEKVGSDPMKVIVPRYAGWHDGENVTAHIEVVRLDGQVEARSLGTKGWNGDVYLEFSVPNELIVEAEGGNLRFWYEAADAGTSGIARYLVGRLPEIRLDKPIVAIANAGVLDPDQIPGNELEIEAPGGQYHVAFASCSMRIEGITSDAEEVAWEYTDEVPGNHPGESMWFYCPREFIESLINRPARFSYTVQPPSRRVAGPSEGLGSKPIYSDVLQLYIGQTGAPGKLPAPIVSDLVDGVLDPTLLRLLVTVPSSSASVTGATVTLTLQADDTVTEIKRVLEPSTPLSFTLRGYPANHDGQDVAASYTILSPDGQDTSQSDATAFRVGSPVRFNEPIVDAAAGGTLDPFAASPPIIVRPAADAGLTAADVYLVSTENAAGNPLYRSALMNGSVASVSVPPSAFTPCLGSTCRVKYEVTRDGRTYPSTKLPLNVAAIRDNDDRLVRVIVTEGPDRELDLSSFVGDASFTVAPWVWMHAGQRYWITCRGKAEDGTPVPDLPIAPGAEVTSSEVSAGLTGVIRRSWLDQLGEGSTLAIALAVTFDGSNQVDDAVAFRVTELTIVKQPPFKAPVVLEAVGDTVNPTDSMTIATEPHPRVRTGMYYWASVVLVLPSGQEIDYPIASRERITNSDETDGVRLTVPQAIRDQLSLGQSMTVQFSVNLKNLDDPFDATPYPERKYKIGFWTATWDLEDQDPALVPPIGPGQALYFPLMIVRFLSAAINPDANRIGLERFGYTLPDYFDGVVLYIGAPPGVPNENSTLITFNRSWSEVRFAMTSLNHDVDVEWQNAQGYILQRETVKGGDPAEAHDVQFAFRSAAISRVVIQSRDVIRLDFFKFRA